MKYTQFLIFEVCLECNLGAVHGKCPNKNPQRYRGGDRTRPMADEQIIEAAAQAHASGFRGAIGFHYYNEPLLAKERIFRLIAAIRATTPEAKFILWTNGTFIPTEPAELAELSVFDYAWVTAYDGKDYSRLRSAIPNTTVVKWGLDNRSSDPLGSDNRKPCCRMFSEMVFDFYGNVHLCCIDWRGDTQLGNIHDEAFPILWARFAEARGAAAHEPMLPAAPAACLRCVGRHPAVAQLIPEIANETRAALPEIRAAAYAGAYAPPPPVATSPAAVFVAYRMPEERLRDHFRWNGDHYQARGLTVYVVTDRLYDGLPGYVRQLVYEDEMPVFSLTKTKNRGIRNAIESGHSPVIATDADIMWTGEALDNACQVTTGNASVPLYLMATDETLSEHVPAPKATGTVTLSAQDWRRVHYHEGCVGYGSDDGIILRAILRAGIKSSHAGKVWHVAHIAGTPQQEFRTDKPRMDHWGRGDGFNPENFAENRKFYHSPEYHAPDWGLTAASDITFVMAHYRMPDERLLDCIRWNDAEWRRIGARVIVVSDRRDYPPMPDYVRVAVYPRPLEKFNLSKVSNYGIRLAGSGIIVKTDPDIMWPREAIDAAAGVTDQLGVCPVLRMAHGDTPEDLEKAAPWPSSKGTLALTWGHWEQIRGYDERMEGYGIEDGDAFHRAGHMCRPVRDVERGHVVYHIAHTSAPQSHGNTRWDCWGRGSGFNPRSHNQNQQARNGSPWAGIGWGCP